MKRTRILRVLSAMLLTLAATAGATGGSSKFPPAGYDESRDPAADLKAAVAQAQRENKRILLEVGGEWCIYCRILNKVIHDDERLTQRLRDGFVVVKVNFSDRVKNEAFFLAIRRSRPTRISSSSNRTARCCSRRLRTAS